eukprot:Selendium_serpulae@DN6311_c1_g1_i1.p1
MGEMKISLTYTPDVPCLMFFRTGSSDTAATASFTQPPSCSKAHWRATAARRVASGSPMTTPGSYYRQNAFSYSGLGNNFQVILGSLAVGTVVKRAPMLNYKIPVHLKNALDVNQIMWDFDSLSTAQQDPLLTRVPRLKTKRYQEEQLVENVFKPDEDIAIDRV